MVDQPIERNTGPPESQHHSASTPPTPRVAGAFISTGDSGLAHQVGASALLRAEPLISEGKPGDREPPSLQQGRQPTFENKVEFNESSSKVDENQNAMKDEISGGVSVRGPADLESSELDASQSGSDDEASIAEKEVSQSKKSSENATGNRQPEGKSKGAKKKANAAKSGKEHRPPPPEQSASSRNVNANSQIPKSPSPDESATQKVAKDKSAQEGNARGNFCS